MLGGGQGESSYIQNPEQARTPRAGTTRTRSRVGTPTAAPVHRTENNTTLVLLGPTSALAVGGNNPEVHRVWRLETSWHISAQPIPVQII